jgi:hypothetical protein
MNWSRSIRTPITLRDGRKIGTLFDAHRLVRPMTDSQSGGDCWRYAGELIAKASDRGDKYSIMDARAQLVRALRMEGLI